MAQYDQQVAMVFHEVNTATSGELMCISLHVKYMESTETVTNFIFLGSKIIEDGNWSHKIKRHLLLGRKTMTNLDSILKSRDITLLTKVRIKSKLWLFQ